ncbi:MAG TPA: hypothetical protein VGF21_00400 [Thermoleophilaceae bacterium]
MLIDDRPHPDAEPRPIDPNWAVVRWLAVAGILGFAGAHAGGFVGYLILCAVVYAVCRALVTLVDYGDGLREWRQ